MINELKEDVVAGVDGRGGKDNVKTAPEEEEASKYRNKPLSNTGPAKFRASVTNFSPPRARNGQPNGLNRARRREGDLPRLILAASISCSHASQRADPHASEET